MSKAIDQKAYLQKYLGGPSVDKKKKKKKAPKGKGFKIILDDEVDITKLRPLEGDELDILDDGEDGPQIAGIIDERPEEVKKLEQFKSSSKWRVVTQDDGFSSKLQIEEIKKDIKEVEKENELVFGKMYSDSEDEKGENKNDSDPSPPRSTQNEKANNKDSKKKPLNHSDSDFSPPRKRETSPNRRNGSPSRTRRDSPARKAKESSKRDRDSSPKKSKHNEKKYDSDVSPPRKTESKPKERTRKASRWGDFEETHRQRSESPKRSKRKEESRKSRRDSSDSDASPPRKKQNDKQGHKKKEINSRRQKSSESDLSPPRKRSNKDKIDTRDKDSRRTKSSKDRRQSSDSDLSPPRNRRKRSESPPKKSKTDSRSKHRDSSSDLSPPRRDERNNVDNVYKRNDDSPPPTNKKMEKTLEGKLAGLQNARQLREENQAFRRREDDAFKKMTDDVSGRNAQVVSRKAKRETSEDRQELKDKQERQRLLDEKYKKWSRGLKQIEAENERMEQFVHEASKPLARLRDDKDLEHTLREIERDGDPMLAYIRDKKRERGDLGPAQPTYKGSFPPNRFNLRPGYRWDGVDRSNGYEKKYFDSQSKRKAQEEEAYKWSTEDL